MFLPVLIFFVIVYLFLKRRFTYWEIRNVPFPEPSFPFGNTGSALLIRKTLTDIFCKIYRDYPGHSYVGFFNLWHPALVIRDPELVKDVLVKEFADFHNNWIEVDKEVDLLIAYNPFVLQNEEWKTIRAQLTPQFTSSKIKQLFPLLQKECNAMVDYIKSKQKYVEVKDLGLRFTGDNVFNCAYGLDGDGFTKTVPDTFKIIDQLTSRNPIVQVKQSLGFFLPTLRRLLKTTFLGDPVPRMFWDVILNTLKYREENKIERNDYMNFLLELKKKDSSQEALPLLVAHAFTFFLDGVETSAIVLAYALYELSQRPDLQEKARKDIASVLEKHETLTYEALRDMTTIENIVFESLRRHPPIRFMSRVCTNNFTFPHPKGRNFGSDVLIEKGTHIFIPVEAIHNDAQIYPNPADFDPGRFDEEAKNSRPKCSFLGFGNGPRICLGRKFALEQIKMGLVAILSNFDLKLSSKTANPLVLENVHIFNAPRSDILVEFHPRS